MSLLVQVELFLFSLNVAALEHGKSTRSWLSSAETGGGEGGRVSTESLEVRLLLLVALAEACACSHFLIILKINDL